MKIKSYHLLSFVVGVVLFIIPFFWLKPGEMNLGGDSSRLYFYDPFSYLHAQTLYSVISSGTGGSAISYYAVPYMMLLLFVRIFLSPTFTISFFHGLILSIGFFSCYFIVKELISAERFRLRKFLLECICVLAGLFYLFSPAMVYSGWDRAILSHIQIFINPLMFFLMLRYLLTHDKRYLLTVLLLTFVFSLNFSFVGAPSFFAFYPFSLLFLILYVRFIRKKKIPVKDLLMSAAIFFLLQSFHIMPHILNLFASGSDINTALFSDKTKFVRGLYYFSATAPNIKVSLSFFNLPQVHDFGLFSFASFIFPLTIVLGFLWNKSKIQPLYGKSILLTGIFFLIVLFFVSANVTALGLTFYKSLFYIPGFQMFRNFYGQWAFAYVFFYTLIFGQALAILATQLRKKYMYLTIGFVSLVLLVNSWRLLNGSIVNSVHFQSKGIKQSIRIDPIYEKALHFVESLPVDGKILTLPLPGPGYQVIAGKDGGAYIGPSTFSYLAGRSDFTGYDGLNPYGDFFLQSVRDKKYPSLFRLFSLLNIRYIFYNSDPYIYDENFPSYPYDYVRKFLPKDQKEYKDFINTLPLEKDKKIDFGDKYHFYPIKEELVFPHIYTTTKTVYTTDPLAFSLGSSFGDQQHNAIFYFKNSKNKTDNLVLELQTATPLFLLKNNSHLHRHEPFITVKLDSISYPFVLLREKFELWRAKKNHDRYIDFSLFYIAKRVYELASWSEKIPISKHEQQWQEPKLWEFYKWKKYNSWEASISRYKYAVIQLIQWTKNAGESKAWVEANKIKINEQLLQHQIKFMKIIKSSNRSEQDRAYLLSLVNKTLTQLFTILGLNSYDTYFLQYDLLVPKGKSGEYEVYVEKDNNIVKQMQQVFMDVNGKIIKPLKQNGNNDLIQFNNVAIDNFKKEKTINVTLHIPPENLLKNIAWENSGDTSTATNAGILKINNVLGDNSGGLVQQIDGWKPNKQYLISFDYQTFGDDFIFKVFDKQLKGPLEKQINGNEYLEKNLNAETWKTNQSIVSADIKSLAGFIQILGNSEKTKSELLIKNLSVVEIQYPKVFFKKIIGLGQKEAALPHILFTKINPTKYRIEVRGASNPYTLVFLEQFNGNWVLQDVTKNTKNIYHSFISRLLGNIGRIMVNVLVKDKPIENNIVASYFNGEVNEGFHRNTFLEPRTFETWGKEAIARGRHFQVNGYANGWNIEPKDMNGKTNYTLILEMTAQKQVYPLLFISFLTVIFILLYFFIRFFWVNEKAN